MGWEKIKMSFDNNNGAATSTCQALPDTAAWAYAYRERGWWSIPLPPRSKSPDRQGWQEYLIDKDQIPLRFMPENNVGLLLGKKSGVFDVDLDSKEAVAAARYFLPPTGLRQGRPSRPTSHLFYQSLSDVKTAKFEDSITRKMICELRSTGCQTIVEPSMHPDGEEVSWEGFGEPGTIEADQLRLRVGLVAACALLARHWPPQGSRHDFTLAISGFLLRRRLDLNTCTDLLEKAASIAGDEECQVRARDVEDTAKKIAEGSHVTGLPTVGSIMGEDVAKKMATMLTKWLALQEPTHSEKEQRAKETMEEGDDNAAADGTKETEGETGEPNDKKPKETASQILMKLAQDEDSIFFRTPDNEAFVDTYEDEIRETWPIRSKRFRLLLRKKYYERTGKALSSKILPEVIDTIEANALFEGDEREVFTRVGIDSRGFTYIDLGDPSWRAVEIVPGHWTVMRDPPIRFRRGKGTFALPVPVPGGSLEVLRPFLNLASQEDWILFVAFLVNAIQGRGPYLILAIHGEQGSGKSTNSRVIKGLIDPGKAPLKSEPREARDLAISAEGAHVLVYDNLSAIPRWLSDAFCRLSTGGGFSTRTLFENREEEIFEATRPVILNGIEEVLTSGDVIDRSIIITTPEIDEKSRREESEFWKEFEAAKPRIIGALYDLYAKVLTILPGVRSKQLLRMADFHKLGMAVEQALGWPEGTFEAAYRHNRGDAFATALEASPAGSAFLRYINEKGSWSGTASLLLSELERIVDDTTRKKKSWPSSPRGLAGSLRRLAQVLRTMGVDLTFDRETGKNRERLINARRMV